MPEERTAVLARVHGTVQGVYFRGWTKAEAERRGLTGWVRNEPDGSVTALVAGPPADVDEFIRLLWKGPPSAAVESVSTEPTVPPRWPARFEIVR